MRVFSTIDDVEVTEDDINPSNSLIISKSINDDTWIEFDNKLKMVELVSIIILST
jgi:hypothetical protein